MKIFIASFATVSDLDCNRDDNPYHDMDVKDCATPSFTELGLFLYNVEKNIKTATEDHIREVYDYHGALTWVRPAIDRNGRASYDLLDADGRLIAVAVITSVENVR